MRLKGKVAIVTGALSGIGKGIADSFAREGADVVMVDIGLGEGWDARPGSNGGGGKVLGVKADVTKWSDVEKFVDETMNSFGRIDVLVNNVGIPGSQDATILHTTPEEEWDRVVAVNLKSVYLCSKRVIPQMLEQGGGKIINLSSVAGIVAFPGRAAYTASKGGVSLLTKSMAIDYAKYRINVNAICPGMVETPMTKWRLDNSELRKEVESWIPWKRVGTPDDISGAAVFLASGDSDYVTGHLFVIDGGLLAR
jgi:NAD(P)-dependent dehydrogenase (short-subunit alcohol dehydrogenase family)